MSNAPIRNILYITYKLLYFLGRLKYYSLRFVSKQSPTLIKKRKDAN